MNNMHVINLFLLLWFTAPIVMGSVLAYFINRVERKRESERLDYLNA